MKRLFRYQYDNETNYSAIILIGVMLVIFWLIPMISQYWYYMENFNFKTWLAERVGMGIFPLIFWGIIIFFLAVDGKDRKEIILNGKYYDGEIVGSVKDEVVVFVHEAALHYVVVAQGTETLVASHFVQITSSVFCSQNVNIFIGFK